VTFGAPVRLRGMFTRRTSLTTLVLAATGAVALGATGAAALSAGTLTSRSVPVLPTVAGYDAAIAKGSVRLAFPTGWSAKSTKTSLVLHSAHTNCTYAVTVKADYVLQDRGGAAAELVKAAAPATGPYLLDSGVRGSAAWRVTRVKETAGTRTRLLAVRMAPSAITPGRDAPLPSGKQVYARTTVRAIDRKDDECHTGTYRDALGPSIGDALAVQKGQGYLRPRG